MESLVKIAKLYNEIEAQVLDELLSEQKIPHLIRTYHDSALDGLYQTSWGWGHVEAPEDRKAEVLEILDDLRKQAAAEAEAEAEASAAAEGESSSDSID